MVQLSRDSFTIADGVLTITDALRIIAERITPVAETEELPLALCDGRILSTDVVARVALPPFANSAVDGYAVHSRDIPVNGETALRIVDRVQAGAVAARVLGAGEAVRIFTGAPMPPGADTIYMQEDVRVEGEQVFVPAGLKPGANVRPAGEELAAGQTAIAAGRRLLPQDLALASAAGFSSLCVRRRLKVAVFSTGDELKDAGALLGPAQVYDSNRFMLIGLLGRLGLEVADLGILPDDLDVLTTAFTDAGNRFDLVITSGGVSMGEADYAKEAVERVGQLDFWRFAIKPGRPLAMGRVGQAAFVGLPGNPVAVFVTLTQIVRGLIAALAGETWQRPVPFLVASAFAYRKKPGRSEFVRVTLQAGDTLPLAMKFEREGAAVISSLTRTDGLVELNEACAGIAPGDSLMFTPFAAILA